MLAQAIYFSAYYNSENKPFDEYVFKYELEGSTYIKDFHKLWKQTREELLPEDFDNFQTKLKEFSYYKKTLKKSLDSSNKDRLARILSMKQFFSVPWLICYDYLF